MKYLEKCIHLYIYTKRNASGNVICEMAEIMFRPQYVDTDEFH